MKRIGTLLMAMAVVAALLAIPLGVSAATSDHDDEPATAGEQLGGVLGVQGAALNGDLSDRTFGQKIANADSDETRADLIADRMTEIEDRIGDHEDRLADLDAKREAGEISEGRYKAQVATLEAERANTERKADRAGEAARGLPDGVLVDRGIDVDRIDELRTTASELGGPATGEAAREIAGTNVSESIAGDRGERPGADRSTADRESDNQEQRDRTDNTHQSSATDDANGDDNTADDNTADDHTDDSEGRSATEESGDDTGETQHSDRGNADHRPN